MHHLYKKKPCPYYAKQPMYPSEDRPNVYKPHPQPYCYAPPVYSPADMYPTSPMCPYPPYEHNDDSLPLRDYGPAPYVVDIEEATKQNNTFRTALWTGEHLQVTLMCINPGEDIGLEVHPHLDQFIRIEEGQGIALMGDRQDRLDFQKKVYDDYVILVPAGKWHNLINTGHTPLKLYSIYAPPEHPHGTVHVTKAAAEAAEKEHAH